MPTYEPGTVVLVNFPFTDLQSSKVRPALVLAAKGGDVIVLGIFPRIPEDVRPSGIRSGEAGKGFHLTGLKKTSVINTEKITLLHRSLIKKQLGRLSPELFKQVKRVLAKTLEIQ